MTTATDATKNATTKRTKAKEETMETETQERRRGGDRRQAGT